MFKVKALMLAAAASAGLLAAVSSEAMAQRGHGGDGHHARAGFPPGAIGHAGWRGQVTYGPRLYGRPGGGFLPAALVVGAIGGVAGLATGGYGLYDEYEPYPYQPAATSGSAQPLSYSGPIYGYAPVWRPRRVVVRHHSASRRIVSVRRAGVHHARPMR